MFEILQQPFGVFEKYILKSTTSEVAFVPAFGGNILSLKYNYTKILWGFENEAQLIANDKSRNIHLAPFPNRIQDGRYFFEENNFQLTINKPKENNTIHGFVWNKPFEVVAIETEKDFAAVTLKYIYYGNESGYPFPFQLVYKYTLKANSFNIAFEVINTGENNMPFGLGWHPYFTLGKQVNDWQLQLPKCNILEVDVRLIPTGRRNLYDCFAQLQNIDNTDFDTALELTCDGHTFETKLHSAATGNTILINQSSALKYLQVYIPPDRNCIAIEPMTCPANAFNSQEGLQTIKPQETFSGNVEVNCVEVR